MQKYGSQSSWYVYYCNLNTSTYLGDAVSKQKTMIGTRNEITLNLLAPEFYI
jgi:hypothetical protein